MSFNLFGNVQLPNRGFACPFQMPEFEASNSRQSP
jgi:hypothetical protein